MFGPFDINICPVFGHLGGVYLWWYGLAYSAGFVIAHLYVRGRANVLGLSLRQVYDLSILLITCSLAGGRLVQALFHEWHLYRNHLELLPMMWTGGMATHGMILGGMAGLLIFSIIHRKPYLNLTDNLVVPYALLLTLGRLGDMIDGQVLGQLASVSWTVQYPDAEGYRHPVALYGAMKNLAIIPVLLMAKRLGAPRGFVTGLFLFLYAGLRIFIDLFRVYPTTFMGMAAGQYLNIVLSILGLVLMLVRYRAYRYGGEGPLVSHIPAAQEPPLSGSLVWRRLALGAVVLFLLCIPSGRTQDVPARYGARCPALLQSTFYPALD